MQSNLEHVPFDCITRFIEGVAYRWTMEQKSATDVFSQWAIIGKDEGMERGHAPSVKAMLELALPKVKDCLLYTSPSPRDQRGSRMPSSA